MNRREFGKNILAASLLSSLHTRKKATPWNSRRPSRSPFRMRNWPI
jgi:hypothetical protein